MLSAVSGTEHTRETIGTKKVQTAQKQIPTSLTLPTVIHLDLKRETTVSRAFTHCESAVPSLLLLCLPLLINKRTATNLHLPCSPPPPPPPPPPPTSIPVSSKRDNEGVWEGRDEQKRDEGGVGKECTTTTTTTTTTGATKLVRSKATTRECGKEAGWGMSRRGQGGEGGR